MLPFSCSHRPGVCITRPNCKARSDGGEGRGRSWLVANEAFSLKSASVRWAGWSTVTYGRVSKLKTRVGKGKKFFRRFAPNFAHPGLKPCRRPWGGGGGGKHPPTSPTYFQGIKTPNPQDLLPCPSVNILYVAGSRSWRAEPRPSRLVVLSLREETSAAAEADNTPSRRCGVGGTCSPAECQVLPATATTLPPRTAQRQKGIRSVLRTVVRVVMWSRGLSWRSQVAANPMPVFENTYFMFFSDFKKTWLFTFFWNDVSKSRKKSLVLNPSKWVHILRLVITVIQFPAPGVWCILSHRWTFCTVDRIDRSEQIIYKRDQRK